MKYLRPISVLIGGQLIILVIFLLFSAIGASVDTMAEQTEEYVDVFWNWNLLSDSNIVQFLIYGALELITLYFTGKEFLSVN